MRFDIPEEIKNKTDCDKNFICLEKGEKEIFCEIDKEVDDEYCLLFKTKFESSCINCLNFGDSQICKCPVRIEIYKRYGI